MPPPAPRRPTTSKQIGIALHSYAGTYNGELPRDIADKDGKPLLSWRVHLLPYVEQNALYVRFKLDEPWDSPANLPLLKQMPKMYANPRSPSTEPGLTHWQGFIGPRTLFDPSGKPLKIGSLPDGSSNTLAVVEATTPVEWTRPGDIPYTPNGPLPQLGVGNAIFLAAMADGSVRSVPVSTSPASLPRRHHHRRRPRPRPVSRPFRPADPHPE